MDTVGARGGGGGGGGGREGGGRGGGGGVMPAESGGISGLTCSFRTSA